MTPPPAGGVLRCQVGHAGSVGSRTQARVADDVAEQAAHRLGTMAILTAVSVVGIAVLQHGLQPEMAAAQQTPLYRLSALFLVLAAVGLAVLERSNALAPQSLLDIGLAFEVAGAFALGFIENSMAWPDWPVRGSTTVAAWIALCVLLIPNVPWKSVLAAVLSAAMIPCAHLLAARILSYSPLPWNRLAAYSLVPLCVAAWTPFIASRLHRMREDLSRTADLGSYQLVKLLGRGGMGEVWVARHRLLRRDAAVKLVLPGLLEHAGWAERRQIQRRFEIEAQAMASLRSPHTVALYDFGLSDEGSLYYAMELLHGLDAQTLVERYGALPAGRVVSLIRQACESLDEAHELGMVHRDVKPSNLFICQLGKRTDFVKLLDFGLVKALSDPGLTQLTMQDDASGTPAFMSPEQVRGEQIDARADIYGLGCVAYFLLTGSLVFNTSSAMAMAAAHLEQRPEPPSRRAELPIPASLERVVMACLEKKPEDRPQSVTELAAMLANCADVPPWHDADASQWWALHRPELAGGALL
jgi:serine/threonine-protein kinase